MKILIVEDDQEVSVPLQQGFENEGFRVESVSDGDSGLKKILQKEYDVVILDQNLPGELNGYEIAKRAREKDIATPIIALTIEAEVEKKVDFLQYADDYLTKPYSFDELLARVQSVLRRGKEIMGDVLELADLTLDTKTLKVTRAGKDIKLRNKEFALLEYLMRHEGIVLSRGQILENVWDMNADPMTNTVDVHIRLLRAKIDDEFEPKLIKTVSGRGYKIEA